MSNRDWEAGPADSESIWLAPQPGMMAAAPLGALQQDLEVDVVIVGGGITGISAALQLQRAGRTVALLEADRIGGSNTGRATGNLYATISDGLYALGESWGDEIAETVVQSRSDAISLIERNIAEFRLHCDFARVPWVLYSEAGTAAELARIEREYDAARGAGLQARLVNDVPLPYTVSKAVVVRNQAQFDPLRYVRQLAVAISSPQCRLFEHTPVTAIDIEAGIVHAAGHRVRADHLVLATHTPKGISILQTELLPYRECAVAAELQEPQLAAGIFWKLGEDALSTRLAHYQSKPYVVLVGEQHRTGDTGAEQQGHARLAQHLRQHFRTAAPAFRWAAQQFKPGDGLPYIGSSISAANVYVATGFGADGLTYGTLAGMLIADEICGRENRYAQLYSARRFTPVKSARNFLKENMDVAGHFLKDYASSAPLKNMADLPPGQGALTEINGEKVAAYRDEQGALHLFSAVCTHMKCIVHWNRLEQSWDCPCHGSRFCRDGSVLEGPALNPLKSYAPHPAEEMPLPPLI